MSRWQDAKHAPKGGMEDRTKTITQGKEKGKIHKYQTWVSPRILGCANGWTTETYWIPPEGKIDGRWHKFNTGVELDGWNYLPEAL
jgi:hypothetical protein